MQNPYAPRAPPPPLRHPVPTHPMRKPDLPITPTPTASASSQASPSEALAARRVHGLDGAGMPAYAPPAPHAAHPPAAHAHHGPHQAGYARYASPPLQNTFYSGASTAAASAARSFGGTVQDAYYPDATTAGVGEMNNMSMMGGGTMGGGTMGGGTMGGGAMGMNAHLGGTMDAASGTPSSTQGGAFNWNGLPTGAMQGMDPQAQMGMQIGAQFVAAGGNYMQKNVKQWSRYLSGPSLKLSFNVSNSYVVHKLRLVLFPWRHKPWSRTHRHTSASAVYGGAMVDTAPKSSEGFSPPREDVNCPDLYIPSMAFVTYILLVAMIHGFQQRFNTQVLGITASRALGINCAEVVFVRLGCYLLNVQSETTLVDLVAYSGYKFVGSLVTLLVGLLGPGALVYWCVWLYTTIANAFFTLRSLRYVVLPDPSSPSSVTITHTQRSKRIQFLFVIAVLQLPLCFALVVGIFTSP